MTEFTEFTQFVNTKKVYHIDLENPDGGCDAPLISKPVWSFVHQNTDGSPPQRIGTIETSPDCHTARITAEMPGVITVSVTALASPTAAATQTFKIRVENHPPVAGAFDVIPGFAASQWTHSLKETGKCKNILRPRLPEPLPS
jgi:hypothetical protein